MPVTQMMRTGAMRRSVQVVTFPLVSQLKNDMWEEEQELQHGGKTRSLRIGLQTVSVM